MLKHDRTPTWAALLAAMALTAAIGCDDDDPAAPAAPPRDLVETAQDAGSFQTLLTAVEAAGLTSTLRTGGPFTVFAPTDAAFAALPEGTLDALLADQDALTGVLLYHVVEGTVESKDLAGVVSAETLNGVPILFDLDSGVEVNGARVLSADVSASNGVIHVIDQVLLPPEQDIVQIAVDSGFSTLVSALQAADLVSTLQGEGPFTVFAPTNEAFAKIPSADLEALLANKDALTDVLLYHVLDGRVFAGNLPGVSEATTVQGQKLTIDTMNGVRVDGASVTSADVLAVNGVIHVIDTVLIPE